MPINDQVDYETADFLATLFAPGDLVLYRPIETWREHSRQRSRVIYPGVAYRQPGMKDQAGQWCHSPASANATLTQLHRVAEREKANLFFGCAPRPGPNGEFDLAWQIRTIRFLWSDIDDTTANEALARCKSANLPRPTAVVASGHGAHLYWLLAEPYHIDDADDPLPTPRTLSAARKDKLGQLAWECETAPVGTRSEPLRPHDLEELSDYSRNTGRRVLQKQAILIIWHKWEV